MLTNAIYAENSSIHQLKLRTTTKRPILNPGLRTIRIAGYELVPPRKIERKKELGKCPLFV